MNLLSELLAINWPSVGLQAAQLILSLSILVVLHELGHFIPAKWFKCRVEKFYLFFDPWFSLFKKKVGETEYGVGWLPLGGYVKIAGMVDESMDKEQMKQPPKEWEFRSKPAWQRLIIMVGGVTVNVLLAFVIYAMILFTWGETKLPMKNLTDGVWVTDSLAMEVGLQNGDKILAVNDQPVEYFDNLNAQFLLGENHLTIERNGQEQRLNIPVDLIGRLVENRRRNPLVLPRIPSLVAEVPDSTNAYTAGLKVKDRIVGIDSMEVRYHDQVRPILQERKGQTVSLTVLRNDKRVSMPVKVSDDGTIGFFPMLPAMSDLKSMKVYEFEHKEYGFFSAFPAGVRLAIEKLDNYIQQFKKILNPSTGAYKGIGGFKSMGSTLYEMITGRKPNEKFLEYAQIVGMVILFGLLLYANGNDWFGWGKTK